jgi:hypothetical protein
MRTGTASPGRRRTAWTALALFVAVWLNMAVQPCLMAAEPLLPASHAAGDCPHCPPADHCDDAGRCGYIDGFDFDARQPAPPAPDPVVLAALVLPALDAPARAVVGASPPLPAEYNRGPPRYLELCRFLN